MRLLLDTSSLLYRAFFALPTSITAADGQPVNAVRGYLDMTARLVSDRQPDDVVHVYDDEERPADRVAAYPAYKAQRAPEPAELGGQFALLREVLDALGQRQVSAPGWEADDAIGTLCATAPSDERIDIVTGDRDLFQLIENPRVRVLFTVRGVSDLAVLDEAAVEARCGVPAARYVDFAILRGDPSDGLPGVPGVGEKTARRLVAAYPDLPAVVAAAGAQTPKLAERLTAAAGYVSAMQAVVPVVCDVTLRSERNARDDARLDELADRHNLQTPLRRLRAAIDEREPGDESGDRP